MYKKNTTKGFTLVELLVGVTVFTVVLMSVYGAYTSIFNVVYTSRAKIDAVDLMDEQFEIVRNLPYTDVGISGGIPVGKLSHIQTIVRDGYAFVVTTTIRNIDDPFDGTLGGTPNDTSPSDYKFVEIQIDCARCKNFTPAIVTTRVAPKNLETASTNGALFIKVFDADGDPIENADVHVENNLSSPRVSLDDVTNRDGMLQLVDVPPGVNAYEITVSKSGFTTDKTYTATVSNPSPTKPHATVALQQLTQLSFIIDRVSTFSINSVGSSCSVIPGFDFNLTGAKLIGTGPNVYKYSQNQVTNGSGVLSVPSMEWDTYAVTGIDPTYDLIGINPISPVSLAPNSTQNVQLVVATKNPRTLLITAKDSATGLPLSGVTVTLTKAGFTDTEITGEGYLSQDDWSGGGGQATSTNLLKYFSSDGNIETGLPAEEIKLKQVFGEYVSSGVLTSSTFDMGGTSNLGQLYWNPASQPVNTGTPNVRVQVATNNDGGVWNFIGPDGTAGTFYTSSNQNLSSVHDGSRYLRYKVFLDTVSTTTSPNLSDVSFTFTTACTPPGQVSFSGLASDTYNIHMVKTGYTTQDIPVNINTNWQKQDILMLSN